LIRLDVEGVIDEDKTTEDKISDIVLDISLLVKSIEN